jgi:hypothetical protein
MGQKPHAESQYDIRILHIQRIHLDEQSDARADDF